MEYLNAIRFGAKTIDAGPTARTDCNHPYNITINDVIYYFLVKAFENRPISHLERYVPMPLD